MKYDFVGWRKLMVLEARPVLNEKGRRIVLLFSDDRYICLL